MCKKLLQLGLTHRRFLRGVGFSALQAWFESRVQAILFASQRDALSA